MRSYLVAVPRAVVGRFRRLLPADELIFAATVEEAAHALAERDVHGIILGYQFDESRALEVLNCLRENERHRTTPMLCLIGLPSRLECSIEAFEKAARALRDCEVLDGATFRTTRRATPPCGS
jgi:response regulator RpfG family c-di-GMP phosphodiesterase